MPKYCVDPLVPFLIILISKQLRSPCRSCATTYLKIFVFRSSFPLRFSKGPLSYGSQGLLGRACKYSPLLFFPVRSLLSKVAPPPFVLTYAPQYRRFHSPPFVKYYASQRELHPYPFPQAQDPLFGSFLNSFFRPF